MAYTNDSKPSGTNTNDINATLVKWDDAVYTWDSSTATWDSLQSVYTNDSKGSGSYSNDTKPT